MRRLLRPLWVDCVENTVVFIRVTGWVGNLSIHIEREFFGSDAPRAEFQGRTIRGLTVEQHLSHLREGLLPLAERSGRVMREALSALEALRAVPSEAVERSRPLRIALRIDRGAGAGDG